MNKKTIIDKFKKLLMKLLKGTYNHYSCFLPNSIGYIAQRMLRLFYSGITINKEQAKYLTELNKKGHIVYSSKYKSHFEFLFYYSRYSDENLPYPQIGLDYKIFLWQPVSKIFKIILAHLKFFFEKWHLPDPYETHYIRDEFNNNNTPAFLSLLEPGGYTRRFIKEKPDPVRYLIEIQQTIKKPIYIVPQWILFSKKSHRSNRNFFEILFGTEENPGTIRRFVTLFQNPEKIFVEIAEPFNLLNFIQKPENQNRNINHLTFLVRQELINRLNRHRQSIVGPVLKTRTELKETILRNEKFLNFMEEYSRSQKKPIQTVYKKANDYLDEIASNFSHNMIQIFSWAITWISNNMFEGYDINFEGLNKLRQAAQKAPLILAPCHKSHIDYLILSYIMYHNNMPCPLIAAGKNLSFWPLGPIFRGGGAFFLRRTFKGQVVYSKVFSEYVKTILKEGFNIEFFIEGGRSRTGKLNLAKLGLLSIILDAYKSNVCPDLYFVPIYIGYDRIIEEKSYLSELEGAAKEPESLSQVVKARKFLKRRYGRIYVQFNDPISFKDVLTSFENSFFEMNREERNVVCRNLGHRIINGINEVSVVTPHALVACALLNCPTKGFMKTEFALIVEIYLNYLVSQNAKLSDTMINYVHSVEDALQQYMDRKMIEKMEITSIREALGDTKLRLFDNKRPSLDYYKNNCISFFIPAAFTALAIIAQDAFQFSENSLASDYEFLQEFFKYEFAYDVDKTPLNYISSSIKSFQEEAIIIPHPELKQTYNITSVGYKKLGYFASFLKTYFESYRISLNVFMEYERENLDEKDCVKKIQNMGYRMYRREEFERKEALSKMTFKNAVAYFHYHDIKGKENQEGIAYYDSKIQHYLKYLSTINI